MASFFRIFLLSSIFLLCFWSSFTLSPATQLGNETDRLSLISFRSQIILDPSNVFNSWNESSHVCQWEGVKCGRKHQRVIKLDLQSKGLVGSISPQIGNLSFLRGLVLFNNSFQGGIPANLGRLSRLEHLLLYNNSLVGEIPVNLSFCSNLDDLDVSNNKLHGNIPTELGSLHKLDVLDLDSNQLTGGIPPSFGNLTALQILYLEYNNLDGYIPTALGQLKRLQLFSFGMNNLSGTVPPSLYNLSNVELFDIGENHLSGNLPIDIGLTLPAVKSLFIGTNQFSGTIPISLFNASKLQKIDMQENNFTGKVPLAVGTLKNLQILHMGSNHLGSGKPGDLDFVTSVTNCTKLYYLSTSGNHFGGTLPTSVGNLSMHTSHLYFGRNMIYGNIPTEIGNLLELIILGLDQNFLSGSIPLSFGNLKNLQELYLNSNQLSGHVPSTRSMSNLYLLKLQNNSLEGTISPVLENEILQIVNLSDNNFSGTIPKEISRSSRLLQVDFSRNQLNGSIPLEVGNLENLYNFRISANNMSGKIPYTFARCLSLQDLYLDRGPVTDLKSANVLLGDDFTAHVGDFGLAKFLSTTTTSSATNASSTSIRGTIGYIPPEYGVGTNVSMQGDVYSYGILLLEIFTGKRPTDPDFKDGLTLCEYSQMASPQRIMEIVDTRMLSKFHDEIACTTDQLKDSLMSIVGIGIACSVDLSSKRMSIKTALNKLISIKIT